MRQPPRRIAQPAVQQIDAIVNGLRAEWSWNGSKLLGQDMRKD